MKIILSFLAIITLSSGLYAQTQQAVAPKPSEELLVLRETFYDFGKIPQGRPVTHEFEVINNSNDTLKIENVNASCGCTTPVWKKEPVAPKTGTKIVVGYNAAQEGHFEKSINIFYNGNRAKIMTIKGDVFKGAATSVPLNTSIGLLKQVN